MSSEISRVSHREVPPIIGHEFTILGAPCLLLVIPVGGKADKGQGERPDSNRLKHDALCLKKVKGVTDIGIVPASAVKADIFFFGSSMNCSYTDE